MDSYGMGNEELTPEALALQEQRKADFQAQQEYEAMLNAEESGEQTPAQSPTGDQQQQPQQQPEATAQAQQSEEPDTSEQRLARQEAEQLSLIHI